MDSVPKYEDLHKPLCGFFTSGLFHSNAVSVKTTGKVGSVSVENKHDLKDLASVGTSALTVSGVCPITLMNYNAVLTSDRKVSLNLSRAENRIPGLKWSAKTGVGVKDGSLAPESVGIRLEYACWGRTMAVASQCKEGKDGRTCALDLAVYSDKCALSVGFATEGGKRTATVESVSSPVEGLHIGGRASFPMLNLAAPEYDTTAFYTFRGTTIASSLKQNCSIVSMGLKQVLNNQWTVAMRAKHWFHPKEGEQKWEGGLAVEHSCPKGHKTKLVLTSGLVGSLGLNCSTVAGLEIGTGCEYNFKKRSEFKWGVSIGLKE